MQLDQDLRDWALEILRVVASMLIPLFALLKTRVDLDRFAAAQRAKETGRPVSEVMRHKWYHRLARKKHGDGKAGEHSQ